jgi:dTDP-4-dehydrorhamnose reductase
MVYGPMNILVTGAKGMLGTDVTDRLGARFNVTACDIGDLDLADNRAVFGYVRQVRPDVMINCAAYTQVDACETDGDAAERGNAVLPRNLAAAAEETGAKLVHISTDYVFDGETAVPYKENDPTNPRTVYGKSKLMGENLVRDLTRRYFIVRIQWLYGKNGGNFVKTILKLGREKEKVAVVDDQFGSPTYTRDVAAAIEKLMVTEDYGIYHITNGGTVSWHDFTRTIYDMAGVKTVLAPCQTEDFPRPAPRPRFSKLDNHFWRLNGHGELRDYKEALRDYLLETGEIK